LIVQSIAAPPVLADVPTRVQASYDVFKSGIRGATIVETFTRNHATYQIESVTKTVGIVALFKAETIRVASKGVITATGLRPTTFNSRRELDVELSSSAEFDWTNNRVTLNDRSGKRTLPLPAGTQDRLSAMYQFFYLPLQTTRQLDFYMTNGIKLDIYNYLISHDQDVKIPLGKFKATHLASVSRAGENKTDIWLSSEHLNFPCKVVITDPDGDRLVQQLTRFEVTP
jgi:hypothetical protein